MQGTCLRLRQNQPQLARRCPLALALALPLVLALDLALAQRVAQFRKDIFQFSIRGQHLYLILAGSTKSTDSQCGRTSQNPTYRSSKRKSLRWIGTFACLFRQDLAILQTNMATSMVPLSIMTCPDRRFRAFLCMDFWTFGLLTDSFFSLLVAGSDCGSRRIQWLVALPSDRPGGRQKFQDPNANQMQLVIGENCLAHVGTGTSGLWLRAAPGVMILTTGLSVLAKIELVCNLK